MINFTHNCTLEHMVFRAIFTELQFLLIKLKNNLNTELEMPFIMLEREPVFITKWDRFAPPPSRVHTLFASEAPPFPPSPYPVHFAHYEETGSSHGTHFAFANTVTQGDIF